MADSPTLPSARTDVAVIGGGIAGCATAFFLAREGVGVTLLEAGELNAQASGANAGSIHLQIPAAEFRTLGLGWARAFAPTLPMLRAGAELWAELPAMLGRDLEFSRTGGVIAARTEAEMALVREKAALEAAHGIEIRTVDAGELRALAPYLHPDMAGGAFCPGEGKANPLLATRAFADAARGAGAEIRTQTPVTGLAPEPGGYRLDTPAGSLRARRVVNAAGARAGEIARFLGIDLAIRGHPLTVSATEPTGPLVPHLVYSAAGRLTLKQMANGSCLIGGGWPSRLRPDGTLAIDPASVSANMRAALAVVPALAGLRVVRSWPAVVNGTDDWRPILGEAPGHPGVYLNLFPWMGFTAGPISALVTAALILGRRPPVALERVSALA